MGRMMPIGRTPFCMISGLWLICAAEVASAENAFTAHWNDLWWTPEQQAQRAFDQGEYATAATLSRDPMQIGIAHYRAGDFKKASAAFGRVPTAEGAYNRGTSLIFQGEYDAALSAFDQALEKRPGWQEAEQNRVIAEARKNRLEFDSEKRGEATEIGADEVVFDLDAKNQNNQDEVVVDSDKALSDQEMRALWLRKSQTSPAVFLKSKFAAQLAMEAAKEPGS